MNTLLPLLLILISVNVSFAQQKKQQQILTSDRNVEIATLRFCEKEVISQVFVNRENPRHTIERLYGVQCIFGDANLGQQQQQCQFQYNKYPQREKYIKEVINNVKDIAIGETIYYNGKFYECVR